jgi:ABC-type branched-subunit amino acid transport system ATPase component
MVDARRRGVIAAESNARHGAPALRVDRIAFAFGGLEVLRSVSFDVPSGEITALVGQNGAGKSTLLNIISGLRRPARGTIRNGKGDRLTGLTPHQLIGKGIARTFQDVRAFSRMTVFENVLLAVGAARGRSFFDYLRRPGATQAREAFDCLAWAGLEREADEPASALSFGQQRRMALAQLLASGAATALLDEPTAGLDPGAVALVEQKLLELNRTHGTTIIVIEHNLPFVRRIAHSVVYLHQGEVARHAAADVVLDDPDFRRDYFGTG